MEIPKIMTQRRSSYSINNALKFKPHFDTAIMKHSDIILSYNKTTPRHFHTCISDALKWLCDNFHREQYDYLHKSPEDKDPTKYKLFRGSVKLRETDQGILIQWNDSETPVIARVLEREKVTLDWKEELIKFIEDPNRKNFKLSGLLLSQLDIEFANNLLASIEGLNFDVTNESIVILR